ncbi:AbrB/MazE/SpoVT family DNA-binding domain-containing protein [Breznakibacter xylanolyticus]|nr:hypothetical protein [Breznakibacter xylanolyticus]
MKAQIVKVGKNKAIVLPRSVHHLFNEGESVSVTLVGTSLVIEHAPVLKNRCRLLTDDVSEDILTDLSNELQSLEG